MIQKFAKYFLTAGPFVCLPEVSFQTESKSLQYTSAVLCESSLHFSRREEELNIVYEK